MQAVEVFATMYCHEGNVTEGLITTPKIPGQSDVGGDGHSTGHKDTCVNLLGRTLGILILDEGVILHAQVETEDRTRIEVNGEIPVSAIVRDSDTGRWRYDQSMRRALGIDTNPDFTSDLEAGNALQDCLPPLQQLREFIRGLLDPRCDDHC